MMKTIDAADRSTCSHESPAGAEVISLAVVQQVFGSFARRLFHIPYLLALVALIVLPVVFAPYVI